MTSDITQFYKDQTILLSGGTGFIGKVIIECLLKKCEIKKFYLLIRTKNNASPKERADKLFESVLFDKMKTEKPDYLNKIELISGDLVEENLGLSEESQSKLKKNVDIAIHGAATVRFDDSIKLATTINVKGTLEFIKLCQKMEKLKSFVYISTAFSNCPHKTIEEKFYDSPIRCDKLVRIVENFEERECNIFEAKLLGKWPNTYTFSKAVAEDAIRENAADLPVCIVRPAITCCLATEPLPGWIGNLYGLGGLTSGVAHGIIRVIYADPEVVTAIVPADMVANCILAAAYRTGLNRNSKSEIPIYNFSSSKLNKTNWAEYTRTLLKVGDEYPLEKTYWHHSCILEKNKIKFIIFNFLLHFIPALLADIGLFLFKQKTITLKLYRRGMRLMSALSYFSKQSWTFGDDSLNTMWNELSDADKKKFNFDMEKLDWDKYFAQFLITSRVHSAKEPEENLPAARRKLHREKMIEQILKALLWIAVTWYFFNLIIKVFPL